METPIHRPVLLNEVLEILNPQPGETHIDATVNGGGHARAILARIAPSGTLFGIDRDCELVDAARERVREDAKQNTVILACGNYRTMQEIAAQHGLSGVDGILFDLGFSSHHIERSGRGFSFLKEEPLDMRYNPGENRMTAEEIVNRWPEDTLADIFSRYGEERFAPRIARGIVRARKARAIRSTEALSEIITQSVPAVARRKRLHPATRTFQALRIAVNEELESLEQALPAAVSLLAAGGRIAIISFHSLEDRIVKTFMRSEYKKDTIRILTAKPVRPEAEEIRANPRARSARLRAAVKI